MELQDYHITLSATFTADPMVEALSFWMEAMGQAADIQVTSYNQVFQQLLASSSALTGNRHGANVVLVRIEDWTGRNGTVDELELERIVREFTEAVRGAAARFHVPCIVGVCPASLGLTPDVAASVRAMEPQLVAALDGLDGVYPIGSHELLSTYPVEAYYHPHSDALGHIPYTDVFFTALAGTVARTLYALSHPAFKVIVLDCDQTLWQGVCGEVGATGVQVDPPRKMLQQFMVRQAEAGRLLCLCSKNHEDDVFAVFDQHPGMLLQRKHLVGWRINWQAKSENLRALAEELNLGLDSFIFLDDDPVQCAEVRQGCPEVLTLQVPAKAEDIPSFLRHVWAFDHLKNTDEDRRRAAFYRQNHQREQVRAGAPGLNEFLKRLELNVTITAPAPHHMARMAQLTQRTNQFNATARRRTEQELRTILEDDRYEASVVHVSDRFGDYGVVGLMVYETTAEALRVDTFLLSCRAMGRGVEHTMLNALGEYAETRGLARVVVPYLPTSRNEPVALFLESLEADRQTANDEAGPVYFGFTAAYAKGVRPDQGATTPAATAPRREPCVEGSGRADRNQCLLRIAHELNDAARVHERVEARFRRVRPEEAAGPAQPDLALPDTPTEKAIARIWSQVLRLDPIRADDHFFQLGGNSLQGTLMLAHVFDQFQVELPLTALFEAPTLSELATVITREQVAQAHQGDVASLLQELSALSQEEILQLLAETDGAPNL